MAPAAGAVVTETFDYDGGRQVAAYVPADPFEHVVFAADGGWHTSGLVEDVRGWVQSRFDVSFDAARTAVWGASLGGDLETSGNVADGVVDTDGFVDHLRGEGSR